jgi:tetratricopeptide (TPR) repeat protein
MDLRGLVCRALFLLVTPSFSLCQAPPVDSLAAQRETQNGVLALQQGQYPEAAEHFRRAEKLAGAASAEINAGIAIAELQLGHFDIVRERESRVLETVSGDHRHAEAYNIIGMSWLRESALSTDGAAMLHSAEDSFRRALQFDPGFDSAYFNLGETLLQENRDAEAAEAFRKFIAAAAKDPAQNAGFPLQSHGPAPKYNLTDRQGGVFSSEAMSGRFVLLEFWATWCPPCIRALPVMRELAHYFPPAQLTVISVDEETTDDSVWRRFIAEHNMDWTQVRDQGSETYFRFPLSAAPDLSLPRYVFLDRSNAILRVYNGTDRLGLVVGQVVRTVNQVKTDAPQTHAPTVKSPADSIRNDPAQ